MAIVPQMMQTEDTTEAANEATQVITNAVLIILSSLLWLHASENPSSILCVVSGHICTYFYHNPFSGIVYSIMSNKTLPYHMESEKVSGHSIMERVDTDLPSFF